MRFSSECEVIQRHLQAALAGEPMPGVREVEGVELVGALRVLLNAENSPDRVAAFWIIALASMKGLNMRLRAAAECERALLPDGGQFGRLQ